MSTGGHHRQERREQRKVVAHVLQHVGRDQQIRGLEFLGDIPGRDTGVLVRDRSYELPGCVRVTVGTREQALRFLAGLEEIW